MYLKLTLKDGSKEFYSSNIPLTSVHNLIIGTPYIDLFGKVNTINHTTGELCDFEYKQRGWRNKNAFITSGIVKDKDGNIAYKVEGKWNESLKVIDV